MDAPQNNAPTIDLNTLDHVVNALHLLSVQTRLQMGRDVADRITVLNARAQDGDQLDDDDQEALRCGNLLLQLLLIVTNERIRALTRSN